VTSKILTTRTRLPFPVPPDALAIQVLGQAVPLQAFLYGGFIVAEAVRDVLRLVGRPLERMRVLDLGCGCARVLRWFADESATCEFVGSDISRSAIEWSRENIPFAEFHVNAPQPPLPLADGSCDLVLAISVVTHIDEASQLAWLEELRRVLRPGGIAILTVSGDDTAAWKLPGADLAQFRASGHFYKRVAEGGLHGLPDFYQDAYHSREYIERVWTRYFDLLAHVRYGPMFLQDLIVLAKDSPAPPGRMWLDLPMAALSTPTIGDVVSGDTLPMCGWSFHPGGGSERVDVWVDGRRLGSCIADKPSPLVAGVFPAWPAAADSVFEKVLDISSLSAGPHVLKLAPRSNLVATLSSYFIKE
jgi:SAM-dependent methyltransferase